MHKYSTVTSDVSLKLNYEIVREPANPVVGQPVTFTVKVTNNSKPVANTAFNYSLSKQGGLGINTAGFSPVKDQDITTDAAGILTASYTPNFDYPLKDINAFDVGPTYGTITTHGSELGYDPSKPYTGSGPMYFSVYPRWLNVFRTK